MADETASTRFRAFFESAFQAYEKTVGVALPEHPLAVQLRSCDSAESITAILQGQVQAFREFRGSDKVMKLIGSTVSILTTVSAAASLGDAIGLVRQRALMASSTALTVFYSPSHLRQQYTLVLRSYLLYVPLFRSYPDMLVTCQ
jgi:hypothetical protein